MKFTAKTVTDQKRLVRGEQWLFVRRLLRARDERHSMNWRVLILAGGAPHGEIAAIRELMPKAHIVAVDRDRQCLEAAIDAGADDVIECDLYAYEREVKGNGHYPSSVFVLPQPLRHVAPFDAIHLDFCGLVCDQMKRATRLVVQYLLINRGCLIQTFSYGRDVVEMFLDAGRTYSFAGQHPNTDTVTISLPDEIPDTVAGRLLYLGQVRYLRSVMLYRGPAAPMVSALYQKYANAYRNTMSVVKVEPGDFELAVTYPDAVNLYDCPESRIKSFRQKFAAIKAVMNRSKADPKNLIEMSEQQVSMSD